MDGDYTIAAGKLELSDHTLIINGDLILAGVTYIGGDFTQYGQDSGPYCNFPYDSAHKTVLNGAAGQTIVFENTENRFCVLELHRPRESYSFSYEPCWITLIERETPVFGPADFILPAQLTAIADSAVVQIRIPAGCAIGTDAFDGCEQVTVFGAAGSPAESYCANHANCEFVAE